MYKGSNTSCQIPIASFSSPYEGRVRCSTTCVVNDVEEQLWSNHSSAVQCVCMKREKEIPEPGGVEDEKGQGSAEGSDKAAGAKEPLSVKAWGVIIFVVLSVLTLILAFVLGRYATL